MTLTVAMDFSVNGMALVPWSAAKSMAFYSVSILECQSVERLGGASTLRQRDGSDDVHSFMVPALIYGYV